MGQVGMRSLGDRGGAPNVSGNASPTPGIVFRKVMDADGRMAFTHINAAVRDICGLEPQDVIADASSFYRAVHSDDLARLETAIRESAERGAACELEFRMLAADGGTRWMHGSCAPEQTPEGDIAWDGVLVDITERKIRADRDTAMIEAIPIPASVTRLSDSTILYANSLYSEIFGTGTDDVVGRKATDLYQAPEQRQTLLDALRRTGCYQSFELELKPANGATMWAVISARLFEFAGEQAIFSSLYDITETKRAELEARENAQRFRNLVEGSLQGVLVLRDDRPLFANQALADILGYGSPEEIVGQESVAFFIHPEELPRMQGYGAARLRGEAAPANYEFRAIRKDGSIIWLNARPVPVEWDGEPALQATYYDVTDQRRAQDALRESERRLQDYLEAGSDWFWETDEHHRYLSITAGREGPPAFDTTSFIGKTRVEVAGSDVISADPELWQAYEEDLAARRPFRDLTYKKPLSDGADIWIRTSGVPVFDNTGSFAGYRGIATNITAQVEAEARANAAQRRLAAAIDSLSVWIAMFDADDRLVLANQAWWAAHEAVGISPVIGERHEDYLRRLLEAGMIPRARGREDVWLEARVKERRHSTTPHEIRSRNGGWLLIADTPLPDGGLISTYTNITKLKRAEQAKSLLHSTLVAANQAPDFEQALRACLAAVCEHTGWRIGHAFTLEESAAEPSVADDFWHVVRSERYAEFTRAAYQTGLGSESDLPGQALAAGKPVWMADVGVAKDNPRASAARACSIRSGCAFPVRSEGRVAAIVEFFSEEAIEPQEQILEVFDHLGDQLGNVLERRRADENFRQAQKMEAVGQLTGGLAHDFNNLLAVILGNLELVEDGSLDTDQVEPALQRAARAAEKGADLTSRLLAFSRRQSLRPEATDVNQLISGFVELMHRTLGEHLWIRTGLDDEVWAAQIDRGQLEAALLNLAINARDAMPLGGRLFIETNNVEVGDADREQREHLAPGRYVSVSVSDTGLGISNDDLDKVFEPFFTTKETGSGSGLGLSMVYGFAKQSHGHVDIQSKQGLGTRVRLYLPAAPTVAPSARAVPQDAPRGRGEVVLVVEDDLDVGDLVKRVLTDLGYQPTLAKTAEDGLKLLDENDAIALLLTDMVLPDGVGGLDLVERARLRRPALKAVLMSGYSDQFSADSSGSSIEMPLIAKPFRKADLARIVRQALDEPIGS